MMNGGEPKHSPLIGPLGCQNRENFILASFFHPEIASALGDCELKQNEHN
jgi:hypothetical protein